MVLGEGCQLCVSVAAADSESLGRALQEAAGADLAEARLDALRDPSACDEAILAEFVRSSPAPLGFTCRPSWEGGQFSGPESDRRKLLRRAANSSAAFIDVELDAEWAKAMLDESPAPVILSRHWQNPCPAELEERAAEMARLGPAVAKLVAPAETPSDALPILRAGRGLVEQGQAATAFCIGEAGRFSRLLAASYGAALTYAAPVGKEPVAAGQWPLATLANELRLRRWRRGWGCCGLVGHPIEHSLSPTAFNAAFEAAGLPFGYLPMPFGKLEPLLEVAEEWEFRGLSVTMPFKREATARCAELEPLAEAVAAVNTLVAGPRGWVGHNTDATAVVEALSAVLDPMGRSVAIVGAGGAARAAAVALARAGASISILNRTTQRAEQVAALVAGSSGPIERLESTAYDVVINATPVGMLGSGPVSETPFSVDWLRGEEVVFDLVYRPRNTALLQGARQRGCTTIDGLEMFLRQAAAQYRLWTGEDSDSPLNVMREAAEAALGDD